jgi:hypothetical protein
LGVSKQATLRGKREQSWTYKEKGTEAEFEMIVYLKKYRQEKKR